MSRYRQRGHRPASLTSMIDVLFILLFASLARATAPPAADATPDVAVRPAPRPPVIDAAPVDAATDTADAGADAAVVTPGYAAAAELGLSRALEQLGERPAVVLRISAAGELVAVESGAGDSLEVGVHLLERVPDRDVGLAYLGDRSPDMQLCALAGRYAAVDNRLVVFAPAAPLADLTVALVGGLRRDVRRCRGGLAVIVEPVSPKLGGAR